MGELPVTLQIILLLLVGTTCAVVTFCLFISGVKKRERGKIKTSGVKERERGRNSGRSGAKERKKGGEREKERGRKRERKGAKVW